MLDEGAPGRSPTARVCFNIFPCLNPAIWVPPGLDSGGLGGLFRGPPGGPGAPSIAEFIPSTGIRDARLGRTYGRILYFSFGAVESVSRVNLR